MQRLILSLPKPTGKRTRVSRKLAKEGNAVGVDDATVYGWAVHYYDEDDIKVKDVKERVEVVAPTTVQEPVVQEPVKEEKPEPVKQKSARKKTKQELQKIFDSRQLSLFDM